MFFNHNGVKLEINNRNKIGKSPEHLETNNTLLNNPWVTGQAPGPIKQCIKLNETENVDECVTSEEWPTWWPPVPQGQTLLSGNQLPTGTQCIRKAE